MKRSLNAVVGLLLWGSQAGAVALSTAPSELAERWSRLRAGQPALMIRDAAAKLGVSEAELLATTVGQTATRLQDGANAASEIMRAALDLGTVLAMTRNENGVIERTGVAARRPAEDQDGASTDPDKVRERNERARTIAGGYLGGDIDLRFTFKHWQYAFAVVQPGRDGNIARSLQFFNTSGMAVHKVYLKNQAGIAVFDQLVARFRHAEQAMPLAISAPAARVMEKPDRQIDVKQLHLAWTDMTDVHQFNRIVNEFGLSREQAMRLAPPGMAQRLTPTAVRSLLDESARQQIAIMAFLGNGATIQIYSGKISRTEASGDWYNVLDPQVNLHLRDSAFKSGWLVRRAGIVSVEFYDTDGQLVVTFFGVREPGKPQPEAWTKMASNLPKAN